MKLHSPAFEKVLRRGVKQAVKSSRHLRRQARASRKYPRQTRLVAFTRWMLCLLLGLAAWQVSASTGHLEAGLAVITLWSFLFIPLTVWRLRSSLTAAPDLPALSLLPISAPTIFRWELQRFFRGSLFSLLDVVVSFGALACFLEFSLIQWILLPSIILLTWVFALSLSVICTVHLPRFPYQIAAMGFILGVGILLATASLIGAALTRIVDAHAAEINLILPTGWAISLFQLLLPAAQSWNLLLLLLPIGGFVWTAWKALPRLENIFHFQEFILPEPIDLIPEPQMKEITEGDAASVAKPLPDNPLRLGPTAIAEIVEKRQFLQSPQWRHLGWLERTLWGWFSTREKAISEFAFPDGLSISHSWKRLARSSLILLLIAMFLGWLAPLLEPWALGFGIFITICRGLALVLNSGRAFHSAHSAAILMPCYAAYGLGFRELSSTLLKFSVIQYPMLIALTVACSAPVAWLGEVPMTMGLLFGLKAGLLLAGARLILLVFSFSSGTNDSSGFHVRSIFLLGVIVIGGILFLVLAGASLFVPGPGPAWLLLGMAQLDAYIFFRIYGWFYNATRIDLMSLSRQ